MKKGEASRKFLAIESLGKWCARTCAWHTGCAAAEFAQHSYVCRSESVKHNEDLNMYYIIYYISLQSPHIYNIQPHPSISRYPPSSLTFMHTRHYAVDSEDDKEYICDAEWVPSKDENSDSDVEWSTSSDECDPDSEEEGEVEICEEGETAIAAMEKLSHSSWVKEEKVNLDSSLPRADDPGNIRIGKHPRVDSYIFIKEKSVALT
jgi:hypothetical protein